jgi:hypothetical protein
MTLLVRGFGNHDSRTIEAGQRVPERFCAEGAGAVRQVLLLVAARRSTLACTPRIA